jgi:lysophospholipase L1-like esterase
VPAVRVLTLVLFLTGAMPGCGSDTLPAESAPGASAGNAGAAGVATSGSGGQPTPAGGAGTSAGSAPGAGSGGSAGVSSGGGANAGGGGLAGEAGNAGAGGTSQEPKKPIKLWMAGDSTMQECSSACPCGWGSRFDQLFDADVTVVNRAVGGRSVGTWLYEGAVSTNKDASGECTVTSTNYAPRWNEMLDATSGMQKGDYLFIQFGINDSTSECPRHVGQDKFKNYLAAMAKAALDRGATPVLVTPVSSISCNGSTAVGTRGQFVDSTKTAAATASVPLVDLHQLSVARYTELGLCPNNDNYGAGKVGDFFCQDHTHFESAGAEEIAKLVAKAISDAKLPLADYLLPESER